MSDDISDIAGYYDQSVEDEHTRMDRHQLEYDLTWRILERYLPAQGSILEIGAATGRYTLGLARRGYAVTAVDISPAELAKNRGTLQAAGLAEQVRTCTADARDLDLLGQELFDAVLLMGPLYHLVEERDRELALRQAVAHLRPGGVLFSAFISRYGILGDLLHNMPEWIEDRPDVRALLETGQRPAGRPRVGFRGYFAAVEEIVPLHETTGLETILLAGVEPAISADDEGYNRLEGKRRGLWLDLLEEICVQPSQLAASRHLLYAGLKRSS